MEDKCFRRRRRKRRRRSAHKNKTSLCIHIQFLIIIIIIIIITVSRAVLGFCNSTFEVFIILGYGTVLLDHWCVIF